MSESTEGVPFRTRLRVGVTNLLQKHRTLLLSLVILAVVVLGGLAIWTQIDSATKIAFATQIDKAQTDYTAWSSEVDPVKKAALGKTFESDVAAIQQNAPMGYGLSKAWFLRGTYEAAQKRWAEAAKAYRAVFEKDPSSYLAPVALVNAGVSLEENGDTAGALAAYADFEKAFSSYPVLAPQVLFTEGRLLEQQGKKNDAVTAYKKLPAQYPESDWTKLARDRIIVLTQG